MPTGQIRELVAMAGGDGRGPHSQQAFDATPTV
eukprot:COSAG06_NODE_44627_length_362_cov_0.346008_1_plen_32_part_10